jgi:hypothetical protein
MSLPKDFDHPVSSWAVKAKKAIHHCKIFNELLLYHIKPYICGDGCRTQQAGLFTAG